VQRAEAKITSDNGKDKKSRRITTAFFIAWHLRHLSSVDFFAPP
jgi:hypothetical protein